MKSKFSSKESIEDKISYKNVFAILTIIVLFLTIFSLLFQNIQYIFEDDERNINNYEFVVDCSDFMNEKIDNKRKIDIAIEAAKEEFFLSERANVSLRIFSGNCEANSTKLILDFSTKNYKLIEQKLNQIQLQGKKRPLINAIVGAMADFNDAKKFKDVNKTIIIITSGSDTCLKGKSADVLYHRLERSNIETNWYIVGLSIPNNDKNELKRMAVKNSGKVFFPNNELDFINNLLHIKNKTEAERKSFTVKNDSFIQPIQDISKKFNNSDTITSNNSKKQVEKQKNQINDNLSRTDTDTVNKKISEIKSKKTSSRLSDYTSISIPIFLYKTENFESIKVAIKYDNNCSKFSNVYAPPNIGYKVVFPIINSDVIQLEIRSDKGKFTFNGGVLFQFVIDLYKHCSDSEIFIYKSFIDELETKTDIGFYVKENFTYEHTLKHDKDK